MTGQDIYKKALDSLGYTDDPAIQRKAFTVLSQIYDELFGASGENTYSPPDSLGSEIKCKPNLINAYIYGVASRLALGEGDGEQQQFFAAMYEKAKARLTRIETVKRGRWCANDSDY
jgi:hypothetical protein